MYECNYSREPVNFRLLGLRILKRIWMLPASFLAGAVLICGIYFIYKTVITGRTYQIENIYYIDFAEDSSGTQYDWVNQYTWSTLADMDVFIDGIYEELGGTVTKEQLRSYSDCTIESDGRYLYMRITTHSPELSKKVAGAYEKTLFAFCEGHKEFKEIRKEHSGDITENSNIRVKEVSVVGGVIGLMVLLVIMLLLDMTDTSIYIPATIEQRYHIKTLGAPSMKEFLDNCNEMLKEQGRIACVCVDEDGDLSSLNVGDRSVVLFNNPCVSEVDYEDIRGCDNVCIALKAGSHNGKMFERVVEQLSRLEITIDAVMLTCEDETLIKKYYRG